jgi:radical SAM protein
MNNYIYSEKPMNVYWEVTRACDLACKHCRAEAIPDRHLLELNTDEGKRLLEEIRSFGDSPPRLILTGGDPLKRDDLFSLIEYGTNLGLPISITPSGTQNLTRNIIRKLVKKGIQSMALSLDGSTAELHDSIRGIPGCFRRTISSLRFAREVGLPLQINTLVTGETITNLPEVYDLLKTVGTKNDHNKGGISRWSLFFLISVGRGVKLKDITPDECTSLFQWLNLIKQNAPFIIATTEAPHFRQFALTEVKNNGGSIQGIKKSPLGRGFGIRDGNGIMFISHIGEVCPAGFLPVVAGDVRHENLVSIYRDSQLFTEIRDPKRYKGKCGVCEFNMICGGSRSRAFALTEDYLESDPLCSYEPKSHRRDAEYAENTKLG